MEKFPESLIATAACACGLTSAVSAAASKDASQSAGRDETSAEKTGAGNDAGADAIVVTGIRASIEDAIHIKRTAPNIVDAEEIGKFPDQNIAEALQRIGGAQISREAGEGKNVSFVVERIKSTRRDLAVNEAKGVITISIPKILQNDLDTIITLDFARSLRGARPLGPLAGEKIGRESASIAHPFNYELVYGTRVGGVAGISSSGLKQSVSNDDITKFVSGTTDKGFGIATASGQDQWIQLDLGKATFVTGIYLDAITEGSALSVALSKDGKAFFPVWQSSEREPSGPWEIEVNDFIAGAQTPGREARYVRVSTTGGVTNGLTARQMGIWSKVSK